MSNTPQKLGEIFNRFARRVQHEYPHMRGEFLLINLDDRQLYGAFDFDKFEHIDETALETAFIGFAEKAVAIGSCASRLQTHGKQGEPVETGYIIAYKKASHLWPLGGMDEVMFSLFHELGHHVVKDALALTGSDDQKHFAEVAADIYALIRIRQQRGADISDILDQQVQQMRTIHMVESSSIRHYTALAIDAFMEDKSKFDFDALTPAQSADIAWRYAVKYSLPISARQNIAQVFTPFREALKQKKDMNDCLLILAQETLSAGEQGFRTGMIYLSPYLFGNKPFGKTALLLEGDIWDDMRRRFKEKAIALREEGILFNTPLAANNNSVRKAARANRRI